MKWNSSLNKAREINQDKSIYGTFAEIGAGQEVARYFFLAGQASQTVAKTISAYDMTFSDEIYGKEPSGRYVCQNRLIRMLDKEYSLLLRRLKSTRGTESRFFAFANTVATSTKKGRPSHGWIGVRFQHQRLAEPSQIIIHARLIDLNRLQQQETLGILGVDLIHACYYHYQSDTAFLNGITENIKPSSIEIDFIKVEGPAFTGYNNPILNLQLVHQGWSHASFIDSDGEAKLLADSIYQKPIILQRGHFNPVTITHVDIMEKASQFQKKEFGLESEEAIRIFELTTFLLQQDNKLDSNSFRHRMQMIHKLGFPVLVTNFKEFYKLKEHLRQSTNRPISFIIPASHLEKLFSHVHYQELSGGLLEGLGKLLDDQTHFYVYPYKTPTSCITAQVFQPTPPDNKIYSYFLDKGQIRDLAGCEDIDHYIRSEEARIAVMSKKQGWERLLPSPIVEYIQQNKLYMS
jgi:nicotinic acid mononucleotide adenylyltransferase